MDCPSCNDFIPPSLILAEAGRIRANLRETAGGGRPKRFKICRHCAGKFGAREMREHLPRCPKRKKSSPAGRKPKMKP